MRGDLITEAGVTERLEELRRLLAIRTDRPGFAENIIEIQRRVDHAEARLAELRPEEV